MCLSHRGNFPGALHCQGVYAADAHQALRCQQIKPTAQPSPPGIVPSGTTNQRVVKLWKRSLQPIRQESFRDFGLYLPPVKIALLLRQKRCHFEWKSDVDQNNIAAMTAPFNEQTQWPQRLAQKQNELHKATRCGICSHRWQAYDTAQFWLLALTSPIQGVKYTSSSFAVLATRIGQDALFPRTAWDPWQKEKQ